MAKAKARTRGSEAENSIIALDKFILSTRDSGYKSTSSAIAELVDNSLQAGASEIQIHIESLADGDEKSYRVAVVDNGRGMDEATLLQALRFGGSSRYNDRAGLGRFGMGLPNASLSQARNVSVYSWRAKRDPIYTYIDVDEIAAGNMKAVPKPKEKALPGWVKPITRQSGTIVIWDKCDRLDNRRISTMVRKLQEMLGRMFRYFLWDSVSITVNGEKVSPIDPLYLKGGKSYARAKLFEKSEKLEIYVEPDGQGGKTGVVTVTFTELPVAEWHSLSNEEKRRLGVANGAGVSIIRGSREVDYGWFFMGGKRRENYDDWWRCEIRFDPILDEAFGITHTKQQIRPKEHLLEALQPLVEATAKALNGRVRQAHLDTKVAEENAAIENVASERDRKLKPLPIPSRDGSDAIVLDDLSRRHPTLKGKVEKKAQDTQYHLVEDDIEGANFFKPVLGKGAIVAVINPRHRFYKALYKPIVDGELANPDRLRDALQLFLLAAARAEAAFAGKKDREVIERFRAEWSSVLDVMLRK